MCMSCWLISLMYLLPAYLGWGVIGYEEAHKQCAVLWGDSRSYTIFINTTCYPLPIAVMVFCYVKLIKFHRQARNQLQKQSSLKNISSLRTANRERKLTLMLLIVVAGLFTAWFLYTIVMYSEAFADMRFSPELIFVSIFLGYSNSNINFWVYAMMSSTFRKGLRKICCFLKRHKVSVMYTDSVILSRVTEAEK